MQDGSDHKPRQKWIPQDLSPRNVSENPAMRGTHMNVLPRVLRINPLPMATKHIKRQDVPHLIYDRFPDAWRMKERRHQYDDQIARLAEKRTPYEDNACAQGLEIRKAHWNPCELHSPSQILRNMTQCKNILPESRLLIKLWLIQLHLLTHDFMIYQMYDRFPDARRMKKQCQHQYDDHMVCVAEKRTSSEHTRFAQGLDISIACHNLAKLRRMSPEED